MILKCKLGFHRWEGCKCSVCGKIRNEGHDLSNDCEKCSVCGTIIENNHNWTSDCEKCSKCGKVRENKHNWEYNCEECSVCGAVRTDKHVFVNGICTVCGHGTFKDKTDGKTYKVMKIGEFIIMAENYAKKTGNHWHYEDKTDNSTKHGLLYDFETAKNIAPEGWHLPAKKEWEAIYNHLGNNPKKVYEKLKIGHSGFDTLYSGLRTSRGTYRSLGASSHFWSNTEENEKMAWHFEMSAYKHNVDFEKCEKTHGLSVRFFKDK
ncbi:MAG: hypothetical protein GXO80_12365 [Chlorobi bacterium]|nr:hypothetical protein [Chlorobiota bacterium]